MQTALALGDGQRVIRQRKVVHAHINIACGLQSFERAGQHGDFVTRFGQVHFVDAALGLEALRQVGVAVQSDTVRAQLGDLLERAVERGRALQWQAVNQIDIDGLKPAVAGRLNQREHLLCRLQAVHCGLHGRVKVLHAKAQAVKAHAGQGVDTCHVHGAGVHLNRQLRACGELEVLRQQAHELAQLVIVHEGRASAAQVQLADDAAFADQVGVQGQFQRQVAQVLGRTAVVLGDDLVAGAVVAQGRAEGNMHIERQRLRPRALLVKALDQRALVVLVAKGLHEPVCGGVRGVARARDVKFLEQVQGNRNGHGDVSAWCFFQV